MFRPSTCFTIIVHGDNNQLEVIAGGHSTLVKAAQANGLELPLLIYNKPDAIAVDPSNQTSLELLSSPQYFVSYEGPELTTVPTDNLEEEQPTNPSTDSSSGSAPRSNVDFNSVDSPFPEDFGFDFFGDGFDTSHNNLEFEIETFLPDLSG